MRRPRKTMKVGALTLRTTQSYRGYNAESFGATYGPDQSVDLGVDVFDLGEITAHCAVRMHNGKELLYETLLHKTAEEAALDVLGYVERSMLREQAHIDKVLKTVRTLQVKAGGKSPKGKK